MTELEQPSPWIDPASDGTDQEDTRIVTLAEADAALKRYARRLRALHQTDHAILAAQSPESIALAAMRHIRELLPVSRAAVLSFDIEGGMVRVLAQSLDGNTGLPPGSLTPLEKYGDIGYARRGELEIIEDIAALPAPSAVARILLDEGLRCYIKIPLMAGDAPLGSLNLGLPVPGRLCDEDMSIALEVADQMAVALQQARLREASARHLSEMDALYRISLSINAEQDLQAVLSLAVESPIQLLGAQSGGLYFLASDGQFLELAVTSQSMRDLRGLRLRLGEGLAGQVAASGQPMIVQDYLHWSGRTQALNRRYYSRLMGVPLRARQQIIGVLVVGNGEETRLFTPEDCRLLALFADQAVIAIENARLYTSLAETNGQLRSALQAKDEMIQNVSHELRTPLTHLMGYAELLREEALGPLNEGQRQAVAIMQRQGESLRYMVTRLLALQALDVQKQERVTVELDPWLREEAEVWMARTAEHGVELRLELASSTFLEADREQLGRVVENLLDNAVKFSPSGGLIRIRSFRDDGLAVIAVSDEGIGIPADKLDHLFERFYQVDGSSTRRFGGMGIGLALCRKIVEAHGGKIWAESCGEGQGSTIFVSFPTKRI